MMQLRGQRVEHGGGWKLRVHACPSSDLAPEQHCFPSASVPSGSQGQAEPRPLASLVEHWVPTALLPLAPPLRVGNLVTLSSPSSVPWGVCSGCPAICPMAINQGRAGLPPSWVESLKGGGPGSHRLQWTLERARAQGTWTDAACRTGLSCCCSGAPAPPVSLWTQAPSDGN